MSLHTISFVFGKAGSKGKGIEGRNRKCILGGGGGGQIEVANTEREREREIELELELKCISVLTTARHKGETYI